MELKVSKEITSLLLVFGKLLLKAGYRKLNAIENGTVYEKMLF